MRSKMIAFQVLRQIANLLIAFCTCYVSLHPPRDSCTEPGELLELSPSAFSDVIRGLEFLKAAALSFSAAYLPIVFAFHTIFWCTAITGNCSFRQLVHLLSDAGRQSCFVRSWKVLPATGFKQRKMLIFDRSCKVVFTSVLHAQNRSLRNNNCVLIIAFPN